MKNLNALRTVIVLCSFLFSNFTFAQSGEPFFAPEGAELSYEGYTSKGHLTHRSVEKVESVYSRGDTLFTKTLVSHFDREANHMIDQQEMKYFIDGITYEIVDFKQLLAQLDTETMGEMMDAGVEISDAIVELNPAVKKGKKLSDATVTMSIAPGDEIPMPINIIVGFVNRKVEKPETVVTPAGEFKNCFKVSSEMIMDAGFMKFSIMTTKDWYAPGIGLVKSEEYEDKKLKSSTELVSFKM